MVKLVPHKVRKVGGQTARDCWSVRVAQVLCAKGTADADIWHDLSYSYLGGGVPWGPPFGYGLVSKRLPLHLADRLIAVCLFLSGGRDVDYRPLPECFVRRLDVTGDSGVSIFQAEDEIEERVAAVDAHLRQLQLKYRSFHNLLLACGLPFPG